MSLEGGSKRRWFQHVIYCLIPFIKKPSAHMLIIMHVCKPSSLKVEIGEPRDQDSPQLNRKLTTIMVYVRSGLKTKQEA